MTLAEAQKKVSESEARIQTELTAVRQDITTMRDQTRKAAFSDKMANTLYPITVPVGSVIIFILAIVIGVNTDNWTVGVIGIILGVLGVIVGIVIIKKKSQRARLDFDSYQRADAELSNAVDVYGRLGQ